MVRMNMSNFRLQHPITGFAAGICGASAVTAVMVAVTHVVSIPNISLLYLPIILMTAVYFGAWPSVAAASVAVLEYDFFLLQPIFTFTIGQIQDVLAFIIFAAVAVPIAHLASQARLRAEAAHRRAEESTTLYELGRALMSGHDLDQLLLDTTQRMVDVFRIDRCSIFVPDGEGRLRLAAETVDRTRRRDRASEATASYVYRRGTEVGLPGDAMSNDAGRRMYVPLRTADRVVGVMEVGQKRSGEALSTEERRLVTSFAAQASLVISRAQSEEERHRLSVHEESDKLKSALLSAVSHDLRTPLASIKASATALLLQDATWKTEEGRELLETIDQEADRLNRLVGNLLDLSRIEAGVLKPALEWYDIREVIDGVAPRLRGPLASRPYRVDIPPHIPPVRLDFFRIEELLINLVENAVKYTPAGTSIEVQVTQDSDGLHVAVVDHGPGIPAAYRTRVFDTFYRMRHQGDRDTGTGLGLAICRGIARAHGGSIAVRETPGGGATFVLTLPPSLIEQRVRV